MELRAYPGCEVDWHFDYVAEGLPENELGESEVIFIKLQVRDAVLNWPEDGRPTKEFDWGTLGDMSKKVTIVRRDEFLSKDRNQALQDLSSLLSLMGFPSVFQAPFAGEIYLYASNFAKDRNNLGRRVIPLSMTFDIFQYLGDEDEILDEVMRSPLSDDDDMDDDEGSSSDDDDEGFSSDDDDEMDEVVDDDIIDSMVPAAKASIDSLQKAKVEDFADSTRTCMICLEELSPSSQIFRMPCSHLYHADCLIQWLETSHVCPLCRFEMPTAAIS